MRVKVGNIISNEHPVYGGAVQGSVMGVMDHNAVMEFLDDEIDYQDIYKYVDDLTMEEEIDQNIAYLLKMTQTQIQKPTSSSRLKCKEALNSLNRPVMKEN